MGDRRNVIINDSAGAGVALYSHWGGTELPEVVKRALAKRWRWDDSAYLARIIFCEMVKGSEAEETGFGIAPGDYLCEASDRDISIDVPGKRIKLGKRKPWVSFEEFVA
jgi:hypothetical protein